MKNAKILFIKIANFLRARISTNDKILARSYDDPLIADYVTRKTLDAHRNSSALDFDAYNYRYFVPFSFLSQEIDLKVLDFGGAAGHHFYSMVNFLSNRLSSWTVIETQSMVESASKLAADSRLKFESSISALVNRDFHLVLASSSIQYSPNPLVALKDLISINAEYYFITRMPLWDQPTTSILQKSPLSSNGPGRQLYDFKDGLVEYEINVMNQNEFEGFFEGKLQLVLRSTESKGVHLLNGTSVNQYGYLFKRE